MAGLSGIVLHIIGNWAPYASTLIVLLLGYVGMDMFRSWHRLSHIKGPFSAGFSKIWLVRKVLTGRMHFEFAEVSQKYGSLVRIGPNDLITTDPDLIRKMLAVRSPYRRAPWYAGMRFDPARENIVSERDYDKHAALRAKMTAGYSGQGAEGLESAVDQTLANFIELIGKYVPNGSEYKPLDFGRKVQYLTLDVISYAAYGKAFGYLAADEDLHQYIQTTEDMLQGAQMIAIFPWLVQVLQTGFVQQFLPSDKDAIGFGKIMGIIKQVVAERFGPARKTVPDMLGSFVHHGLTQEEAESETILQIIAGSDTTATAIRSTFLHMIMNPRVVSKLRAEINNASISSPIKYSEAKDLPYLQAVIKEGLRIWPPVAGLLAKEVPPGGDTIRGVFVPGGTAIGWSTFGMYRDTKIWGENAQVFHPERWIEGTPDEIAEMGMVWELLFSYGKYQCLGKNLALMEISKTFVELLRHFDFAIVDPSMPWKSICNGIFSQSEMWMTVSRREDK